MFCISQACKQTGTNQESLNQNPSLDGSRSRNKDLSKNRHMSIQAEDYRNINMLHVTGGKYSSWGSEEKKIVDRLKKSLRSSANKKCRHISLDSDENELDEVYAVPQRKTQSCKEDRFLNSSFPKIKQYCQISGEPSSPNGIILKNSHHGSLDSRKMKNTRKYAKERISTSPPIDRKKNNRTSASFSEHRNRSLREKRSFKEKQLSRKCRHSSLSQEDCCDALMNNNQSVQPPKKYASRMSQLLGASCERSSKNSQSSDSSDKAYLQNNHSVGNSAIKCLNSQMPKNVEQPCHQSPQSLRRAEKNICQNNFLWKNRFADLTFPSIRPNSLSYFDCSADISNVNASEVNGIHSSVLSVYEDDVFLSTGSLQVIPCLEKIENPTSDGDELDRKNNRISPSQDLKQIEILEGPTHLNKIEVYNHINGTSDLEELKVNESAVLELNGDQKIVVSSKGGNIQRNSNTSLPATLNVAMTHF